MIHKKGMNLNNDFYIVIALNNVVQKMRTRVTNIISIYKLINVILIFICFKLVMKLMKF